MASGCIMGECYICGDLVFEDERSWYKEKLKHSHCKSLGQVRLENEALRKELEEYRKWFKHDKEE